MKKKIIALLQARSDSTRLPKKVLKPILNKPMIIHQLQRTSKSELIDKLILVTSDEKSDDTLASTIKQYDFELYRGDKNNVLKRFYDCVKPLNLKNKDIIVRLTGDCPLHDPNIIDETILAFMNESCDYLANSIKAVYPDGLDVEVCSFNALKIAYLSARKQSDLEHVTPYIRDCGKFITKDFKKEAIYPHWRLTVDNQEDFDLINKIYQHFDNTFFSFEKIIEFLLNNQELLKINSHIKRNEGYAKSLNEDLKD